MLASSKGRTDIVKEIQSHLSDESDDDDDFYGYDDFYGDDDVDASLRDKVRASECCCQI